MATTPQPGDALIIVDVQRDFLPGGALGVAGGDAVVPVLNHCIAEFLRRGLPIYATRDWHPSEHCSFRERGGPWPPHCVAGSPGAQFAPTLTLPGSAGVVSKAVEPEADAYSGFEGTDLAARLHRHGCRRVVIGGLATEYCVRATALDARKLGLDVIVLEDAIRPVEVRRGDAERALAELRAGGVRVANSREVCG